MKGHIALYRAWRPQSFGDMVGQSHIVTTLRNALRENRLTHAYLFSGPRGTGKTTAAKVLAKAVNCERGPSDEPCNECESCRRISEGAVMDVVEIDAASNRGVEEIRDIRDKVKYAPTEVRMKVYIIDEVHMLTTEAFNALLKTLEEPPAHVMFVLATTEPHRIPATIISRCQRFDFKRVSVEEQLQRLNYICEQEGMDVEPSALQFLARLSDGGMRDALSLLDQAASFSGKRITYDEVLAITGGIPSEQFASIARAIADRDVGEVLRLVEGLMQEGKSAEKCMENLIQYYRDLLMLQMVPNAQSFTDRILDPGLFEDLTNRLNRSELFAIIDTLNRYFNEMKYAVHPRTVLEVALMKCCSDEPDQGPPVRASSGADDEVVARLTRRLEELERKLQQLAESGVAAAGSDRRKAEPGGAGRNLAPLAKSSSPLGPFVQARESSQMKAALMKWSQVLASVKDRKITVHAWLVDGEPVSATDEAVLLAFKNTIHRETTERPANRQLIEQVMGELFGRPTRLDTVLLKDWNEAISGAGAASASSAQAEELQLVPDDEPDDGKRYKEDWINEAITMFGEDLVKIKDES